MANNIIIIHRPELTLEESARRLDQIKHAAAELILATERAKARKNNPKGTEI
jgi:hypothetical protein